MNYRQPTGDNFKAVSRERNLTLLVMILICVIAVEFIIIAVMWVSNYKYKVMYDEALDTQILMQEEINSLRSGNTADVVIPSEENDTEPNEEG